jgi:hypothetical protein
VLAWVTWSRIVTTLSEILADCHASLLAFLAWLCAFFVDGMVDIL